MAHQSDNCEKLSIRHVEISTLADLPIPNSARPEVFLFVLPFGRSINDAAKCEVWFNKIQGFAKLLNQQSLVLILTSSQDAAETWPRLSSLLKFQLWIAVKLQTAIENSRGQLPESHAALLVLSKYRGSLQHTKTRIAYSYCPACDKTTKDYGGKKHTYHEYGTLMSDVWRDICYAPGIFPAAIVDRLSDLFGLAPYRELCSISLAVEFLNPREPQRATGVNKPSPFQIHLPSALYNEDTLVRLKELPDESVDFCFADPPYNLNKRYDSWDDSIDIKDYFSWCDKWLDELSRILRPGCTCAVLNIPICAVRHFQHMKVSLQWQSWIAWEGLSLPLRMIMPAHYSIVCFSKGQARPLPGLVKRTTAKVENITCLKEDFCLRQSCVPGRKYRDFQDRQMVTDLWWDIHRLKHNSRRVDHPCQLPPALMMRLIDLFTNQNELVLDPFNGAGTTTLCADILNRRYLGIELSKNYHDLAQSRHQLLAQGGDPFGKVKTVPKAKNSRVERIGGMQYKVSKKELQLEVRRIARLVGKLPSREELGKYSRYPLEYYDKYFISWGEVCAAARTTGMTESRNKQQIMEDYDKEPSLFTVDS